MDTDTMSSKMRSSVGTMLSSIFFTWYVKISFVWKIYFDDLFLWWHFNGSEILKSFRNLVTSLCKGACKCQIVFAAGGTTSCDLLHNKYLEIWRQLKNIPFKVIIASLDSIIVVKALIFIPYHVSKHVNFSCLIDPANSRSSLLQSGINRHDLSSFF